MIFTFFGTRWAGNSPNPHEVLFRFVRAEPRAVDSHFEVDITVDELMRMAISEDMDILISGGWIAFDHKGGRFRQR